MIRSIMLTAIILSIFTGNILFAKGSAGSAATYESRFIVDMPTAGVISKGSFAIYAYTFTGGGLMTEISAAPFENFNMGLSYSGSNIVGNQKIVWQDIPGIHIKYRLFDETKGIPAILLGISTQGRGIFFKDSERFETFSPGFFLALSKNFTWDLGTLAVHGGINYSLEPETDNRAPNIYFGFEHSIGKYASLNIEYNANIDEADKNILSHKGLLNASLRFAVVQGLTFDLQLRDLLEHIKYSRQISRFIGIEFIAAY